MTTFADVVATKVREFHENLPLVGDVEALADDVVVKPDPVLTQILSNNDTHGLVPFDVSPAQGKFLYLLAVAMRARRILEIGTLGGYSTAWLARAVPPGGTVVTLEKSEEYATVALDNVVTAGVGDRVDIRIGHALDSLPGLHDEFGATFDLAFIDADKENDVPYLEWCTKLIRPGGLIVVDNLVRFGGVLAPEENLHDPGAKGSREAFDMLGAHPMLDSTILQTVGAKGWDGFGIAVVRDRQSEGA